MNRLTYRNGKVQKMIVLFTRNPSKQSDKPFDDYLWRYNYGKNEPMTVKIGPLYEKIKFSKCPRAPPLCTVAQFQTLIVLWIAVLNMKTLNGFLNFVFTPHIQHSKLWLQRVTNYIPNRMSPQNYKCLFLHRFTLVYVCKVMSGYAGLLKLILSRIGHRTWQYGLHVIMLLLLIFNL